MPLCTHTRPLYLALAQYYTKAHIQRLFNYWKSEKRIRQNCDLQKQKAKKKRTKASLWKRNVANKISGLCPGRKRPSTNSFFPLFFVSFTSRQQIYRLNKCRRKNAFMVISRETQKFMHANNGDSSRCAPFPSLFLAEREIECFLLSRFFLFFAKLPT